MNIFLSKTHSTRKKNEYQDGKRANQSLFSSSQHKRFHADSTEDIKKATQNICLKIMFKDLGKWNMDLGILLYY